MIQTIDMTGCVWPSNMFILGGIETQSLILSMEAQTPAITCKYDTCIMYIRIVQVQ